LKYQRRFRLEISRSVMTTARTRRRASSRRSFSTMIRRTWYRSTTCS
jgi:hypothetical protein